MNKKIIEIIKIIILLILLIALIILVASLNKKNDKFYLDDKYYKGAKITEIKAEKLKTLISDKESFLVFVYQPSCATSSEFNTLLNEFTNKYNLSVYMISFSNIKGTTLEKYVKYYPSFVIFNNGRLIDYLKADSDLDTKRYQNLTDFEDWLFSYVLLKHDVTNASKTTTTTSNSAFSYTKDEVKIDNVTKESGKVNVYFFYGDGCPHCKKEFSFFDEIEEQYAKYYNLYTFEVWNDEYNANLLKIFSSFMGSESSVVPYTIIGDTEIKGFGDDTKSKIKNAIINNFDNDYDVYFDKVLKLAN